MEQEQNAAESAREVRGVPFKKGDDSRRNLAGRGKGNLSFSTKWDIFVEKIAAAKNVTAADIDEELFGTALQKAKDGDIAFYRDIFDRRFGKAIQVVETNAVPTEETIDAVIEEVSEKINGIYKGASIAGDGIEADAVGDKARD